MRGYVFVTSVLAGVAVLGNYSRCGPASRLMGCGFGSAGPLREEHRFYHQISASRTICMNLKVHPANANPTRAGRSIALWEGDTPLVDTVSSAPVS